MDAFNTGMDIYIELDEFEREMTLEDYDDVVCLMRSVMNREVRLLNRLPQVENRTEKVVAYKKKLADKPPKEGLRTVLRSAKPVKASHSEFMWVIGLTADGFAAFISLVGIGDIHKVVTSPFDVFKCFEREAANRVIVIHTHPTQHHIDPSQGDLHYTKMLIYAARHLACTLEDHIILTATEDYSLFQEGHVERLNKQLDNEMALLAAGMQIDDITLGQIDYERREREKLALAAATELKALGASAERIAEITGLPKSKIIGLGEKTS